MGCLPTYISSNMGLATDIDPQWLMEQDSGGKQQKPWCCVEVPGEVDELFSNSCNGE